MQAIWRKVMEENCIADFDSLVCLKWLHAMISVFSGAEQGNDLRQPVHAALRRHPAPANMSKKTQTNQMEQSSGFEFNMRLMNERVSTCHTDFASRRTHAFSLLFTHSVAVSPPELYLCVTTGSTFWRKTQQRRRWRLYDAKRRRGTQDDSF